MTYLNEFKAALTRAEKFKLSTPEISLTPNAVIMSEDKINNLSNIIAPVFEEILSYDELVGQCMSINLSALPLLTEWLQCPVYYTIGWIDNGTEKGIYKFDDDFIEEKLTSGHKESLINLHVWLTLPSMEIIDLTICTSWAVLNHSEEGKGRVLIKNADDLTDIKYRPMLIGDDFLFRIGLIKPITWYEFN